MPKFLTNDIPLKECPNYRYGLDSAKKRFDNVERSWYFRKQFELNFKPTSIEEITLETKQYWNDYR
ncbi:hypothetical protein [Leptospira interrogans]|uniref:Uncharacterized protein n=1 Tax=Leptospira interrogans serovar Canicola TaxID=211880 RepID=A0AAP9WFC0_LEPIR|nr:hypothetical protein [Leptospira interrogans]EMN71489.1 hypothetical protein LEP1GSC100_0116 [Leptospira interrogans serovar Bataviae str. UI 08561]QOI45042.1 hypothetical protein Lepto782_22905 [Leptospira interrogans serovar Canicola]